MRARRSRSPRTAAWSSTWATTTTSSTSTASSPRDPWNPADRAANRDLLDDGTLSVARFDADGTLTWLPLVAGRGAAHAGERLRDARPTWCCAPARPPTSLGATPMDAPEGFIPHPQTGKIYVAMTENEDRLPRRRGRCGRAGQRRQSARAQSRWPPARAGPAGAPDKPDHAADVYRLGRLRAVRRSERARRAARCATRDVPANGWFTDPDNLGVDPAGRLWVCTDGPPDAGFNDALYAMDTEGPGRALPRLFYLPPVGAEVLLAGLHAGRHDHVHLGPASRRACGSTTARTRPASPTPAPTGRTSSTAARRARRSSC